MERDEHAHEGSFASRVERHEHHPEAEEKGRFGTGGEAPEHAHEGSFAAGVEAGEHHPEHEHRGSFGEHGGERPDES